jgi:hypothetical protein
MDFRFRYIVSSGSWHLRMIAATLELFARLLLIQHSKGSLSVDIPRISHTCAIQVRVQMGNVYANTCTFRFFEGREVQQRINIYIHRLKSG